MGEVKDGSEGCSWIGATEKHTQKTHPKTPNQPKQATNSFQPQNPSLAGICLRRGELFFPLKRTQNSQIHIIPYMIINYKSLERQQSKEELQTEEKQ